MKTLKPGVILLSMLIAAMTIVSMASATEQYPDAKNSVDTGNALNVPEHYIPPEYFSDAKPAAPLSESEMITIILSEKTLRKSGQDPGTGILEFQVSPQNLNAQFMKSETYQNTYLEKYIAPDEPVALIRMPETMYERFLAGSQNNTLTFPASHFCRFYETLTDLVSHIEIQDGVLAVTPEEDEAKLPDETCTAPYGMKIPEISGELSIRMASLRQPPWMIAPGSTDSATGAVTVGPPMSAGANIVGTDVPAPEPTVTPDEKSPSPGDEGVIIDNTTTYLTCWNEKMKWKLSTEEIETDSRILEEKVLAGHYDADHDYYHITDLGEFGEEIGPILGLTPDQITDFVRSQREQLAIDYQKYEC